MLTAATNIVVLLYYHCVSIYSREQYRHGGTCILVRSNLIQNFDFVSVNKFDSLREEKVFEFSIIYNINLNIYIIGLYRSPSPDVEVFLRRLEGLLSALPLDAVIVLCGDLNVNFLDLSSFRRSLLLRLLQSFNLEVHTDRPSRITAGSATMLDYVCSNVETRSVRCLVSDLGLFDHCAVLCSFSLNISSKIRKTSRRGRLFNKRNFQRFSELCRVTDWHDVLDQCVILSSPFILNWSLTSINHFLW